MKIHPTAIVEDGVKLGADVEIGAYSIVHGPSSIGDGCIIGSHAVIHPFVTLGAECRLHCTAIIGDIPQDMAFDGAQSATQIGARCVFREGVTVNRGTKAGTVTVIGDDCMLMVNSHVGHNCVVGDRVVLVNGCLLAGHVSVDDGAFLSGNTCVHQFCRVGRLAMMGGNSAVSNDLPPFCTTRPGRVNVLMGLNTVGMRRAGLHGSERSEVKRAFHLLFRDGLNLGGSHRAHSRGVRQRARPRACRFCQPVQARRLRHAAARSDGLGTFKLARGSD